MNYFSCNLNTRNVYIYRYMSVCIVVRVTHIKVWLLKESSSFSVTISIVFTFVTKLHNICIVYVTIFIHEHSLILMCFNIDELCADTGYWQSTTQPAKAASTDKTYYYLPYWDHKQCMHIRSIWPDHRRRMYNSNLIANIIEKYVSFKTFT